MNVSNRGTTTATNLHVTDTLPANATYVSGGSIATDTVSWSLPALSVDDTAQVSFTVTASRTIINQDYAVIADEDASVAGTEAVFTWIDPPTVSATHPAGNGLIVSQDSIISATFSRFIDAETVREETFTVRGRQAGIYQGAYTVQGNTVQFNSAEPFRTGEQIVINSNSGLRTVDGDIVFPYTWQFRAAATVGNGKGIGYFLECIQELEWSHSNAVVLGDLDNDGDLDAFVANDGADKIWLNNGKGTFSDSGQNLGDVDSRAVGLGDLDGDGDLDAFVGVYSSTSNDYELAANQVWLNDGAGNFTDSGQRLSEVSISEFDSQAVALGDLDGDGDLDAFVGNWDNAYSQYDKVWLNDGAGHFSDSGQSLGSNLNLNGTNTVALGDLDGDGDLDAFVGAGSNKVYINDGAGNFTENWAGSYNAKGVALGDIDNDGDLDAFLSKDGYANQVWRNDGTGNFINTGQELGDADSQAVALGDIDGDGDLDALIGNDSDAPSTIWLNSGSGFFALSPLSSLDVNRNTRDVLLGDLDDDGDLDAFFANIGCATRVREARIRQPHTRMVKGVLFTSE